MGFAEQLQEIIGRLPGGHQTVLFSATLPKLLVEFARAGEEATGVGLGAGTRVSAWEGLVPQRLPVPSSSLAHRRPHGARAHPAGRGLQTQRAAQGEAPPVPLPGPRPGPREPTAVTLLPADLLLPDRKSTRLNSSH